MSKFVNTKNTKQQGNVGIGAAIAYFSELGYTISIPLNDSQKYDLVVDDGFKLLKIQVKTSRYKNKYKKYQVLLKMCGGTRSKATSTKFDKTQVDILFILTEDNERYCIPTIELEDIKNQISLGKKYIKYKIDG